MRDILAEAEERGVQKGRQEGIQEGIQQGRQEGMQEMVQETIDCLMAKLSCSYEEASAIFFKFREQKNVGAAVPTIKLEDK